jgi:hypothetical protein
MDGGLSAFQDALCIDDLRTLPPKAACPQVKSITRGQDGKEKAICLLGIDLWLSVEPQPLPLTSTVPCRFSTVQAMIDAPKDWNALCRVP